MTPRLLAPATAAALAACALTAGITAGITAAITTPTPARADERQRLPADMPKAYTQECASCHPAYPPGLLPRASWSRVMAGLGQHYGTDASLDATLTKQIEAWLLAHAGTSRKVSGAPPDDRITRSAWFERKHRHVQPATWRLPSVKSAASCGACHGGADEGDY
ncbi:MAG: diheme cytochrome c, partial [Rubrivivax sp.]|nr:diheme cytochrome c [Rubrivivax sp.]